MAETALATKYSPETFDRALSNLVERWKEEGGDAPIKYDAAAVKMDKSTASTALKYLGDIGLLEAPKAGSYVVPKEVLDYRTKMGEVKAKAKRKVATRVDEYPLYKESKFMLRLDDYTVDDLAKEVSGSETVAAEEGDLRDVKRSIGVLAELELLEIDEEGFVSIPADLDGEAQDEQPDERGGDTEDDEAEGVSEERPTGTSPPPSPQPPSREVDTVVHTGDAVLAVELDISMDVTDMEANEIKAKLEAIDGVLSGE